LPSTGCETGLDHAPGRAEAKGLISRNDAELTGEEAGDAPVEGFISYSRA
jgi:hypothetical protein